MNLGEQILALEQLLLQQTTRQDEQLLERLLADDFTEVGAVGECWNKAQVIDALKTEAWIAKTRHEFKLRTFADGVVLATYRCRHQAADGCEWGSWCSSIWQLTEQGWQMVFHQGTRIAG